VKKSLSSAGAVANEIYQTLDVNGRVSKIQKAVMLQDNLLRIVMTIMEM
jgi:hypothetical protein